jgi:hypothetical protein
MPTPRSIHTPTGQRVFLELLRRKGKRARITAIKTIHAASFGMKYRSLNKLREVRCESNHMRNGMDIQRIEEKSMNLLLLSSDSMGFFSFLEVGFRNKAKMIGIEKKSGLMESR